MRVVLLICFSIAAVPPWRFSQPSVMGKCKPVSMRQSNGDEGCWILADRKVGSLGSAPVFWYVDRFASREAAEKALTPRSTVVEALGKTWLLTVEREGWRISAGERVGAIGPLPIDAAKQYSAQFMEAITNPGWTSEIHRHPGPEAWYTEGGETCLETPNGVMRGAPGA